MNFLIADTFTDSLAHLTGDEQKAVKASAFDLHLNPASSEMSFHKLDKGGKNFWSVRVSGDIRRVPRAARPPVLRHRPAGTIVVPGALVEADRCMPS